MMSGNITSTMWSNITVASFLRRLMEPFDGFLSFVAFDSSAESSQPPVRGRDASTRQEHPSTLASINNLANALRNQGKHKQAEEMHRQAPGLSETVLGKEHPQHTDECEQLGDSTG